jgi:acyl-CoA reductase-like NAD-dependent aldehyde dehydrogenase
MSEQVVSRAMSARASDARAAASAAAAAFPDWASTAPGVRAAVMLDAAQIMEERAAEVVRIAGDEIGASEAWTRFNIEVAAAVLRHAADICVLPDEIEAPGPTADVTYRVIRKPAGVVLGLAPWNAAVTLATRAVAAPLALGNTVVLKGSELCPKTHEWVCRAFHDAGLPPGVLNYITNSPENAAEVVDALIAHPAVRRVNFTGSTRVGREIAVQAAQHLKPCLLELSGKGTMIVLADADLKAAARAAAEACFMNQGQICMSTERVLVEQAVADEFAALFAAEAQKLRADGAAHRPLGTLISAASVLRLRGMVEDALSKGARLIEGGEAYNNIMQPTILDDVTPGMRIYSEEAFGPIAGIVRVWDADEAMSMANDSEFGLVASVFSGDASMAEAMLREIEVGIGHVNRSTVIDDPTMPFGGMKASGYGRFGGQEALHEFTDVQWLTIRKDG